MTAGIMSGQFPAQAPQVRVSPDAVRLAEDAAACLVRWCAEAVAQRGLFSLALSGGETPLRLFNLLAHPEWQARMDWKHTLVFWVDERCVAQDHPRSNAGAARRALFDKVAPRGLFPMDGAGNPEQAAQAYAACLREQVGAGGDTAFPALDCVLLGLGRDGHTASLFPGTPAPEVKDVAVTSVWVPEQNEYRLTLTLPMLNAARRCVFMATGAGKREIVRGLLQPGGGEAYPALRVRPAGELVVLGDEAALGKH